MPVYRRLLSDTLTPVSAFHKIDTRHLRPACSKASSAARRSAATAFWRPSRSCSSKPAATAGHRHQRRPDAAKFDRRPIRSTNCDAASTRSASATLPELPPFTGGGDRLRRLRRRSATPRTCRTRPHDDRGLPDLSFAFYDHMVVFDNVNKTIVVVAMAAARRSIGRRPEGGLRRRPAARVDAAGGAARSARRPTLRAGRHRHRRRARRSPTTRTSRRPSSKPPSASAWSTFAPATSFRSSSASGWKLDIHVARRSRSIARCGS